MVVWMMSVTMTVVSEHASDDESAYSAGETGIQFSMAVRTRRFGGVRRRGEGG